MGLYLLELYWDFLKRSFVKVQELKVDAKY